MDAPYVDNNETRIYGVEAESISSCEKIEVAPSVEKAMGTFFCDHKGIIHIESEMFILVLDA